jgi:predicted lipoprotein with Yx(FWY)xxD motif
VVAAIFGAQAFGRSVAATIGAAPNAPLAHAVVVDRQGRTLYVLSPETPHHLLCVSRLCLTTWPPATVSSAHVKLTLGAGVVGPLGVLRRTDGRFQLALRGRPLYRFSADRAKGQANGNALHSFGGTWHVLAPAGGTVVTPAAATTPAATPTTPAAITPAPAPMTTPTTPMTTPAPTPTPPTYPGGYTY